MRAAALKRQIDIKRFAHGIFPGEFQDRRYLNPMPSAIKKLALSL
jgi:hypothetical protein